MRRMWWYLWMLLPTLLMPLLYLGLVVLAKEPLSWVALLYVVGGALSGIVAGRQIERALTETRLARMWHAATEQAVPQLEVIVPRQGDEG